MFNVTVRSVLPNDNVADIAKCIHGTDQYIYPYLFKNYDDPEWIKLISECLEDSKSIFYKDNILLAVNNNDIIGLVVMVPCGKELTFIKEKTYYESETNQKYFLELLNETKKLTGYFLNNFFVIEKFRHKGVGSFLLKEALKKYVGVVHTEAIANNESALRLYKRYRFEVTKEFQGYSGAHPEGIKCVKLIKLF